ncbi:MAG TPA: exodeoxyribonuclease V subunit beta [Candidatus Acidoferrales bacterium]|nr:exodeoxyribonuclease V subunit beta [Candidatus Acidoferrales bacterium]
MSASPRILDAMRLPLHGRHLVEASAGTGKTHTLADLYLRLVVERGHEVDRILVVTFTKAATAEIKTRIRRRLVEARARFAAVAESLDGFQQALIDNGVDRVQALRRLDAALMGFDQAAIFTLHGFCFSVLRDHAFSAGLPTGLTLQPEKDDRIATTAADLWRQLQATIADPCRAFGLRRAGLTATRVLKDLELRVRHPLAQIDGPDAAVPDEAASWAALDCRWAAFSASWARHGAEVRQTLLDSPDLNRQRYKPAKIHACCDGLDQMAVCKTLDLAALEQLAAGAANWASLTPEALAAGVKKGGRPPDHPVFGRLAELLEAWRGMERAWQVSALAIRRETLSEGMARLARQSERSGELGFADLTGRLRDALATAGGGVLAAALRARFPAALIDEFQDTDPAQFDVFRAIYADPAGADGSFLLLIGDPKQAIYGFRGADVHAYLAAREHLGQPWLLAHNWRSVPDLVSAVNAIFRQRPDAFVLPGITYHPVLAARGNEAAIVAPGSAAALQVHLLDGDPAKPLSQSDALRRAALWTADEIAALVNAGAVGEATLGGVPVRGGDVAVLVRAHDQGEAVAEALRERSIGFVLRSQQSVYATDEAQDLSRVLRAVLTPTRMSWLRGAWASRLFAGSVDSVLALNHDEAALEQLLERFQEHHQIWQRLGFMPMWQSLMETHGVAARLLARPDGERRLTNVHHLAELLHDAERSHHLGPEALFNHFERLRQQPPRDDEAALLRLESEADLVRIETIHASKGLQYPIVFCPALWKTRKSPAGGTEALCYHDGALGQKHLALMPEWQPEALEQARRDELAEELRLAYVALTRAQARCYLVDGPVRDRAKSALGWLLPEADPARVWQQLVDAQPKAIDLVQVSEGRTLTRATTRPETAFVARKPRRAVPPPWVLTSFSALWGEAADGLADDDVQPAVATVSHAPQERSPHGFVRGTAAGRALHAILERWSWCDDPAGAMLERLVPEALEAEGVSLEWADVVTPWMQAVVATPLGSGGLRLRDIALVDQVREMAFAMPLDGLRRASLEALIRQIDPLWTVRSAAGSAPLEGALRGVIDLVFAHEGRFYLADYKSNWLGPRATDYTAEALALAMAGGRYTAQALIYAAALHRHLQARLPSYDPAHHFGGVYYLFLRGMAPDAPGRGVLHILPPPDLLDAVSAALAGEDTR